MRGSTPPPPYTNSRRMNSWSQGHSGCVIKTPFLYVFTSVSNDGLLTSIYS
jgi:hypothetical protein